MCYHNPMAAKDLVFPDFNHSVVNLAATLAQFLGKPTDHAILPALQEKLKTKYKNVVYLVVDGMGSRILEKNLPTDSCLRQHQIDEITTVFPSTTAAATTSLLSALTPAEHGWFAWSVDFDGTVIELFPNRNFYTRELTIDRDFANHHLPYHYFFEKPTVAREVYTCYPDYIAMKINSSHKFEHRSWGHLCRQLHQICQQPEPKFVYAYFAELDNVMHDFGTTARQTKRLLHSIDHKIARLAKRHPDTLFVLTADHGQIDLQGFSYIWDDAALQACLAHPVSLDPRGACFKIKPGMDAQFKQAFQKYADDYVLFPSQALIQKGVFGSFAMHPDYQKYLGDYIAVGTASNKMMIFRPGKERHHKKRVYHGAHTGMTPDEMYVPVIVIGD